MSATLPASGAKHCAKYLLVFDLTGAMGASESKTSELFLKIVGNDVVDEEYLTDLEAMVAQHKSSPRAGADKNPEMILSLTYTCILNAETSSQHGLHDIVLQATKNNKGQNISGEIKIADPFARCFGIEQVG